MFDAKLISAKSYMKRIPTGIFSAKNWQKNRIFSLGHKNNILIGIEECSLRACRRVKGLFNNYQEGEGVG